MFDVREVLLRIFLSVAACLVVRGVSLFSEPAAYVVAGVLVAILAVLFFADEAEDA